MQIKQFINEQWSDYADYDNRRSLPHLMDGLKITQRKAMHTAIKLARGAKPDKVSQFASKAAAETSYHHGEVSMMDTVVRLAQDFPGTNNFPLLEKHGQFGTRLSAKASSPRYIHVKLHPNWDTFFKKIDQEIVIPLFDDEMQIEPQYFIPAIPMVLINGAEGVGNGFSSTILNYNVDAVVKGLKELMKYGEVRTPLIPSLNGFTGTIEKVDRQVVFTGKLKIVHGTKLHITELPPGYDNDKYKAILNQLIEDGFIKDYDNDSTEDAWSWTIECSRGTSALGEAKLIEKLRLISKVTENFVGWGIDDSAPMTFESPELLLTYWYHERLKLYAASIKDQIKNIKVILKKLDLRIRFIEWCLKNDIRKLTKAQAIANSVAGVKGLNDVLAGEFVSMPMYRITTDEVQKMELDITKHLTILDELGLQTPSALMTLDLKSL